VAIRLAARGKNSENQGHMPLLSNFTEVLSEPKPAKVNRRIHYTLCFNSTVKV